MRDHPKSVVVHLLTLTALVNVSCQPSLPPENRTSDKEIAAMEPDSPVPFGYKCAWLTIQTEDAEAVVTALGLTDVQKCNWQNGIEAAYRGDVFISPATKGWVFVVSFSLPDIPEKNREDHLAPLISVLSKRFPDVQYFGTHRVVEYHGWIRAKKGSIVRRYAYLGDRGETLCDEGGRTEEETRLGLVYNESKLPQEQDVMKLAGAWSLDPTILDQLKLGKGIGHLGLLPKK